MMLSTRLWLSIAAVCLSGSLFAGTVITPIAEQAGRDIVCTGPSYTYTYDVRQYDEVDANLSVSGSAALVVETDNPYASFFTDTSKGGSAAVFEYAFVAEPGAVFDDISVASQARIFRNACSVTGQYSTDDGDTWMTFLTLTTIQDLRPVDVFEDVYSIRFRIRYTVSWINADYANSVQLFRSWGPEPGQPGDFAFSFNASLITDIFCDHADIAQNNRYIDFADFAVLAADYGITAAGLAGDINDNGRCDIHDLTWLTEHWLCECYDPVL